MSGRKTILLVEDDPSFIETSQIVLEKLYNVLVARDGKECLSELNKEIPDLIILDVMLRYLSEGLDIAKELKSNEKMKNIPIIMLTGISKSNDPSNQNSKNETQKDLWLDKPVKPQILLKEIEKILQKK